MNKKCQIFTPSDYVERLLDSVEYKHNLYGKKIMENSCGDGNILAVVVQRYIDDCIEQGISKTRIKSGLSRDIYGVEIDPEQYKKCIETLDCVAQKNHIKSVAWNIINDDYLRSPSSQRYDYVVGNPPYITYRELDESEQDYLKKNFSSCKKGKFDYCYAFLEKSIESLLPNGKMAYLIPSSVYKTVFGETIRNIMRPLTKEIIDYTNAKLFRNALVKSSIIVIDKSVSEKSIHYIDDTTGAECTILRDSLGYKWNFGGTEEGERRFGDYFKVSHAVATLCNKAFVIKDWQVQTDESVTSGEYSLESAVVRDAASPKNIRFNTTEKIIFPYRYNDKNQLIKYSEEQFVQRFPETYRYLLQYKEDLEKRDSDMAAQWFEYGRSQALNNINEEKALISTIISSEVLVYKLNRTTIPYAGMYITVVSDEMSIDEGIAILQTTNFLKYVRNIGIPINGNSVRITSKDIEDYLF